jgi:DNA-binding LacI/PurR family transcriptional regulator/AraC-like DNA-binding protein/signal transduction histidine kinase
MRKKNKKIAFLLASVHSGSANQLWPAVLEEAERNRCALFLFPGGRLNAGDEGEALRNELYDRAGGGSFDGVLSWASALGGFVAEKEVASFHQRFEGRPLVTIALKVEDRPVVKIDAYTGMKQLVKHLLSEHDRRRLAFIRGPEEHSSAEDRFHAYRDALSDAGIPFAPNLVSHPHSWNEGSIAMGELLDDRDLMPARDFDGLVGASDLLVFDAMRFLQQRGYAIPKDVAVGGFNDSAESHLLSPTLTTIHMPFGQQGVDAFKMLMSLIDTGKTPEDRTLGARLIIRQSCGCLPASVYLAKAEASCPINGSEAAIPLGLSDFIVNKLAFSPTEKGAWIDPLLDSFFSGLKEGNSDSFILMLDRVLNTFIYLTRDLSVWQDCVSIVRSYCVRHSGEDEAFPVDLAEDMIGQARVLISDAEGRASDYRRWKESQIDGVLQELNRALLCVKDRQSIVEVLSRFLPRIDMSSAYLVMYDDEPGSQEGRQKGISYSRLIGWFACTRKNDEKPEIFYPDEAEALFLSSYLLPDVWLPSEPGGWMVLPLFIVNKSLGYLVVRVGIRIGSVYESIRAALSSALQGVLLFDEVNSARALAEQAERLKTRFWANVSVDLREPLASIIDESSRLLAQTESNRNPVMESSLATIREQAERHLALTNRLLDLSLSQIDELSLNMLLLDPLSLVENCADQFSRKWAQGSPAHIKSCARPPLIRGDKRRLSQVFEILAEYLLGKRHCADLTISLAVSAKGLAVCLSGGEAGSTEGQAAPPCETGSSTGRDYGVSIELADRILMLHNSRLLSDHAAEALPAFSFTLPYPTLGGSSARRRDQEAALIGCLTPREEVAEELAGDASANRISAFTVGDIAAEKVDAGDFAALLFDAATARFEDWLLINSLRYYKEYFCLPFIFLPEGNTMKDMPPCENIGDLIERLGVCKETGPLVIFDAQDERRDATQRDLKALLPAGKIIAISSRDELVMLLHDHVPAFFILSGIDIESVRYLRSIRRFSTAPMLLLCERDDFSSGIAEVSLLPKILIVHRGVVQAAEFSQQLESIIAGKEMLPPHTGSLVKNALAYINRHVLESITRWKIAEAVNVNEDYLTRIFHKEMGLSPWEYLNRLRISIAVTLLIHTSDSISEIAQKSGFQDQAYFCRVFKKIMSVSPGKMRNT